jgi:hypothetical protein
MRSFAAVACFVALAGVSVVLAQSGSVTLAPGYIYNYNVANGVSACKLCCAVLGIFSALLGRLLRGTAKCVPRCNYRMSLR